MRKSFKLLLTLALCLVTLGMKAATVTGARTKDYKITYQSVDADNKPITLSARLYYQRKFASQNLETIDFVVLNCHPTITHNNGCPTGDKPQMDAIKYMVSENALVICPDYIGFGETTGTVHPYMCATLTARNVLDCYKAAMNHASNVAKAKFNNNYYTINVGYSQGGATALAFQRYLETQGTEAEKNLVKLCGTITGAGPHDQNLLLDEYENQETLDYPIYMYYILRGHKEAFGKTTMRNLDLKECFTPEFWEYCENNLQKTMDDKNTDVDKINDELKSKGFNAFYKIMSADYKNHKSKVYRTIRKTLAQSNNLTDGWTPEAEVTFFQSNEDIVIPPVESKNAYELYKSKGAKVTYIDAIDNYSVSKNNLWQDAVFGEGILGGISGALGNTTYDFNSHDHRNCGARFYAMFLAGNLRPTTTTTVNRAPSNVAIATPNKQEVAANASSVDGNFDVIKTAMPYAIPAEKGVFVQFPAKVDGYYFGCDAPRYKVTRNKEGEAIAYTPMADLDDFEAKEVYYVVSENEETDPIVSMTAGIKTPTVESKLAWRELNIRKLNILNGKGYATAYMPFAYSSSIAYIGEDAENYIIGKPAASIATGTGAILVNEGTDDTTILEALVENPNDGENESCLSGTYTTINNNGYLTFGRNKADMNEVGFFAYTGSTIKPYSCYYTGSAPAKVLVLNGEETAINSINKNENTEIFTINGTRTSQLQKGINLVRRGGETVKLYIK